MRLLMMRITVQCVSIWGTVLICVAPRIARTPINPGHDGSLAMPERAADLGPWG